MAAEAAAFPQQLMQTYRLQAADGGSSSRQMQVVLVGLPAQATAHGGDSGSSGKKGGGVPIAIVAGAAGGGVALVAAALGGMLWLRARRRLWRAAAEPKLVTISAGSCDSIKL